MLDSDSNGLERTPIQKFYNNSVIFVTGGTGFIGSTLVEKLLRSCPGIKKIYLLIRNKKQKSSEQRLNELFDGPFWEKLKIYNPQPAQYVSLIDGDMIHEDLGISAEDYKTLTREVNIIFHAAATVRFDESLKIAAQLNIQATKNVLQLAEKCVHLKSFVHVSTAYSQCTISELEEKFYPLIRDPEEFLSFCNQHTREELDSLTTSIIGEFPNTYTYTKNLTEQVIKKYDKILPIAITRPSIVMGCLREPVPGWIHNLFGPIGLMLGIAMGLVRVLMIDNSRNADVVPGDLCTNHLIAVAHETSKHNHKKTGIKIYNYGSGKDNPLTWKDFFKWSEKFAHSYACINMYMYLGFYFVIKTTNPYKFKFFQFILHTLPAYCIDAYSKLMGRTPRMLKLYERIHKLSELTTFFSTRQWIFHNDNTKLLFENMDPRDQDKFCFDIKSVEWDVFFFNIIKALRFYILKEPMSTLPKFEEKIFRMKLINNIFIITIIVLALRWMF